MNPANQMKNSSYQSLYVWQHEHRVEENRILRKNLKDVISPPFFATKIP